MQRRSPLFGLTAAIAMVAAACPALAQSLGDRAALGALAAYEQKLAEYERIHGAYLREHETYWDAVSDKRKVRNAKRRKHETIALTDYVLAQPPVYSGPRRPVSPLPPPPPPPKPPRPEIPVAADFLAAAKAQWGFVPDQPRNDSDFKRAYAQAARAAGLTQEQIVGVYAFETGGRGSYDTQAGLEPPGPGKHAISPAMGYNQLLSTNTVALFAEHGTRMLAVLEGKARSLSGAARQHFDRKLAVLKRMIAYCRSLPHSWREYDKIAKKTEKGWGIHAAVLDIDVGPLLQVQKLLELVAVRAHEALRQAAHSRRARADEPDRRRQRHRHGNDAAELPRACADRELLPAARLCAQSGRPPHQSGRRPHRRDPAAHGP